MLPRSRGISLSSEAASLRFRLKSEMDAHLIGIDLAQLLLKHKASGDKRRPVKAAERAAESALVKQMEQAGAESR